MLPSLPASHKHIDPIAVHYPHAECFHAPPATGVLLVWANMLAHAASDAPAHTFTDMHDWGDALLEAGFAGPVMDRETLPLSFTTPQRPRDVHAIPLDEVRRALRRADA